MSLTQHSAKIYFFLCLVMLAGLFAIELTPLPLSIATILLGIFLCADIFTSRLKITKETVLFAFGFIFLLAWYLVSDNKQYFFHSLQIKLPFLILAIACSGILISRKSFLVILQVFLYGITILSLGVMVNYLFNEDSINTSYLMAKAMPTPIHHIRFSLMVSIGAYVGYYLFREARNHALSGSLYILCCTFLLIFAHILSVRSGLIALYGLGIFVILEYVIVTKRYFASLAALIIMAGLFTSAYFFFPTFKNKLSNTLSDIQGYQSNDYANHNTVSTRIMSYKIALEIFEANKLMGCGPGDIKNESDRLFNQHYPEITTPILPHNQFLLNLAATGIAGLLLFVVSFFVPLFINKNYRNSFLLAHYVVLVIAFQFEPMLETQLGVGYTVLFMILGFSQTNPRALHQPS